VSCLLRNIIYTEWLIKMVIKKPLKKCHVNKNNKYTYTNVQSCKYYLKFDHWFCYSKRKTVKLCGFSEKKQIVSRITEIWILFKKIMQYLRHETSGLTKVTSGRILYFSWSGSNKVKFNHDQPIVSPEGNRHVTWRWVFSEYYFADKNCRELVGCDVNAWPLTPEKMYWLFLVIHL
jgi:hypothetical protein